MSRATGEGQIRPLETSRQGCPTSFLLYNFDIGGSTLKTLHERLLDRLVKILERNAEHRIRLVGRASRSGSDAVNLQWSRRRVEAVARYLKDARVPEDRIRTEFIGESAPLSADLESEEDRSVEVHLQIARVLTLVLVDAHLARPTWLLVENIREAIAPLASRAGRELRIVQQRILERSGELTIAFDPGGRGNRPCGFSILGDEAGESVSVGAHEELRVCGESQGDPGDPMNWEDPQGPRNLEHTSQLGHVFENGEPEFARFVANTAIHELGHIMAKLEHTEDRTNYMFAQGGTGANLPRELRTRESMRRYWSSRLTFNSDQERRLVCAIQTGNFSGGLELARKK